MTDQGFIDPGGGPPADARLPVHILTGFLGSGKTTLLRHLLATTDSADTAVVINEFGEVGLDHLLVREVAEDVVLLSSGCLCCTVRDDLMSTLAELHTLRQAGQIPAFRRIIVETTGLALPAPIVQAILSDPRLTPHVRMGQVLTTVDAVNGERTLARHSEARQQLATADLVLITKTDLVGDEAWFPFVKKLAALTPSARIMPAHASSLKADVLQDLDYRTLDRSIVIPDLSIEGPAHDGEIGTFTVLLESKVNLAAFVDWLQLLLSSRGDSILRVKGLMAVDDDHRPVVVQGVQHVVYPFERLPAWPNGPSRHGWIVFIARDLTQRAMEKSLRSVYQYTAV